MYTLHTRSVVYKYVGCSEISYSYLQAFCTLFAKMAYNIHISGPKMIMHNKTLAEMFINQLNNNEGLFGVRYLMLYDD